MQSRELARQLQRLRDLLKRTQEACGNNIEMQSHWAKYLCVLTAGFLENALKGIYTDHAHRVVSMPIANFVSSNLSQIRNPKIQKFFDIAGAFKETWKIELENFADLNGRREAIDSIMNQRHLIAHGQSHNSNITISQVKDYLDKSVEIIEFIEKQCT